MGILYFRYGSSSQAIGCSPLGYHLQDTSLRTISFSFSIRITAVAKTEWPPWLAGWASQPFIHLVSQSVMQTLTPIPLDWLAPC